MRVFHLADTFLPLYGSHDFALKQYIGLYSILCILCSNRLHAVLHLHGYRYLCELFADLRRPDEHTECRNMNGVGFHQMYVSIQSCTRIPATLLRFVLQEHIDIHAVRGDELRQDVTIKGIVSVWPIYDFLAVDIDVRMAHRSVKDQGVELVLFYRHARTIVPFSHPRQTTASTGFPGRFALSVLYDDHFLQVVCAVKRTADRPIVRDRDVLPLRVLGCVHRELPFAQQSICASGLFCGTSTKHHATNQQHGKNTFSHKNRYSVVSSNFSPGNNTTFGKSS